MLPKHLQGTVPVGLAPGEIIAQYEIGNYKNFNYLILDWENRLAAIVDPQEDLHHVLEVLESQRFRLEKILLTHTHFDHIAGLPLLLERNPNLPILVHSDDQHRLREEFQGNVSCIKEGDSISVGSLSLNVWHTPGHSAGECCFLLEGDDARPPYFFTGDTVFVGRVGRVDFPTGSLHQMWNSIQRIKGLDPKTIFLVGHHYLPDIATTLEKELDHSPPFQAKSVDELQEILWERLEEIKSGN